MLHLTEGQDGLWDRFQHGDALDHMPGASNVIPRWSRAASLGVRPDGPAHPLAVRGHELATRRDAAFATLSEGQGVVEAIEAEVAARGLLTIVADPTGVIVRARGGDAFTPEIKKSRLLEGMRWDEAARGTNAIGTALVERTAVGVVGRAHFESINHGLFCYASPVIDPLGDLVAVLDVTGPIALEAAAIGVAVRSATAAMEQILRTRAYARSDAGSRRLVERMVEKAGSAALLIEAPGIVTTRNAQAIAEFELAPGPVAVDRLFGIPWPLLARAPLAATTTFETRRRRFTVEIERVVVDGKLLALACFFEPTRSAVSRSIAPSPMASHPAFDPIYAADPAVAAAKSLAARLAPSEVPILLMAETGTGKELFAQAIHRASPRRDGAFVAVSCGALSGSLLESELFGYAPGAFTGPRPQGAEGRLAVAHRGTLFLDEIAEMSPAVQAMLLRFLEDGSYSRVGDAAVRRSDIRLVCATCRDLPKLVQDGGFRQDLFFRIQGGSVRLPPLRDRVDRLGLARELLGPPRALAPSAEAWVLDHPWPGNVRELKVALAHAVALAGDAPLERAHFPEPLLDLRTSSSPSTVGSRRATLLAMAQEAVARANGNMSEAARALGIARSTLYRTLGKS